MIAAQLQEEMRQRSAPRPDLEDLQATLVQTWELGHQIGEDRVLEACAIAIGEPDALVRGEGRIRCETPEVLVPQIAEPAKLLGGRHAERLLRFLSHRRQDYPPSVSLRIFEQLSGRRATTKTLPSGTGDGGVSLGRNGSGFARRERTFSRPGCGQRNSLLPCPRRGPSWGRCGQRSPSWHSARRRSTAARSRLSPSPAQNSRRRGRSSRRCDSARLTSIVAPSTR